MNDIVARAQKLLEENQYLTLATSDTSGRPWSSTVWYTAWQPSRSEEMLAVEFIWLSRPEALHSRNLLDRPEVGISIFNSAQPAGTGDGLQFAARAEPVSSALLDEAAEEFSKASLAAGGGAWTRAQVEEPALPRLYLARTESAYLLGKGTRVEIPLFERTRSGRPVNPWTPFDVMHARPAPVDPAESARGGLTHVSVERVAPASRPCSTVQVSPRSMSSSKEEIAPDR